MADMDETLPVGEPRFDTIGLTGTMDQTMTFDALNVLQLDVSFKDYVAAVMALSDDSSGDILPGKRSSSDSTESTVLPELTEAEWLHMTVQPMRSAMKGRSEPLSTKEYFEGEDRKTLTKLRRSAGAALRKLIEQFDSTVDPVPKLGIGCVLASTPETAADRAAFREKYLQVMRDCRVAMHAEYLHIREETMKSMTLRFTGGKEEEMRQVEETLAQLRREIDQCAVAADEIKNVRRDTEADDLMKMTEQLGKQQGVAEATQKLGEINTQLEGSLEIEKESLDRLKKRNDDLQVDISNINEVLRHAPKYTPLRLTGWIQTRVGGRATWELRHCITVTITQKGVEQTETVTDIGLADRLTVETPSCVADLAPTLVACPTIRQYYAGLSKQTTEMFVSDANAAYMAAGGISALHLTLAPLLNHVRDINRLANHPIAKLGRHTININIGHDIAAHTLKITLSGGEGPAAFVAELSVAIPEPPASLAAKDITYALVDDTDQIDHTPTTVPVTVARCCCATGPIGLGVAGIEAGSLVQLVKDVLEKKWPDETLQWFPSPLNVQQR